jgi:hypothetical protein
MAEPKSDEPDSKSTGHSDVVTTRVNVAFPFSQIKVQEPSEDVAELAELVGALAALLVDVAPGPKAQALRKRAQALATRLK